MSLDNWNNEEIISYRELYRTDRPLEHDSQDKSWNEPERKPATHANATLVSSRLNLPGIDVHMPVLDLDVEAHLVPSSTPGHTHLYINQTVTWEKYEALLHALADCGILQRNYVRHSIGRRHATFARYPGVTKKNEAQRIRETKAK
jgi:hypothetical protein